MHTDSPTRNCTPPQTRNKGEICSVSSQSAAFNSRLNWVTVQLRKRGWAMARIILFSAARAGANSMFDWGYHSNTLILFYHGEILPEYRIHDTGRVARITNFLNCIGKGSSFGSRPSGDFPKREVSIRDPDKTSWASFECIEAVVTPQI